MRSETQKKMFLGVTHDNEMKCLVPNNFILLYNIESIHLLTIYAQTLQNEWTLTFPRYLVYMH